MDLSEIETNSADLDLEIEPRPAFVVRARGNVEGIEAEFPLSVELCEQWGKLLLDCARKMRGE